MPAAQPNILFIMADQMAAPLLPLHDPQSVIRMPHLERLAREGVVFDSAYCNSPLCAPSRYALVSGQLPSRIGAWDNAAELGADVPTYAHHLRALGYRTALAGKMHFCGADPLHGYEDRLTGQHETAHFSQFRYGVGDRGASIRIPWQVERDKKGYIEDRRPNANIDPYVVARLMTNTVCSAASA